MRLGQIVKQASLLAFVLCVARADAGYVGSRVCSGCHRAIYEAYQKTAMGRSMSPAAQSALLGNAAETVRSDKLDRTFFVYRQDGDIWQSESQLDASRNTVFRSAHKLEYAVGSGVNGYTFLVRRGSYLFQAPLSYYARTRQWDLSPGYESADMGFNRIAAPGCLVCHSGRARPVEGRDGLYEDPPFSELAIGCENCHGPGSAHIAALDKKRTIVNPARLSPRLAEQICMNCHEAGDTRVPQPGKTEFDFRPGTWLADTVAIFRVASADAGSDLLQHFSAMQVSRCFRGSGGKLSCLTCHDPHAMPPPEEAAAYYRGKCLGCHTPISCTATAEARRRRDNDCAGCHMPKRPVEVISHSALTNHRIVAYPGEPGRPTDPASADGELVWVNRRPGDRAPPPPVMLVKAYGELLEKQPAFAARYSALLDELERQHPADGLVQAALGRRALLAGKHAQAIETLSEAIKLGFSGYTAFQDLAAALSSAGQLTDAVDVLKRGIELNPYAGILQKSLALRYIQLQWYAHAKSTMQHYVELFPEDSLMRGLLARVGGPQ